MTVLIVGAGPTGLTMAVVLQRYGIPFRIIDKSIKPVSTSNALVALTRTLEVWDDLGILPKALEAGKKLHGFNMYAQKKKLAQLSLSVLDSCFTFLLGLPQGKTEELMLNFLQSNNILVEMEVELDDVSEQADGSLVTTLLRKNNESEQARFDWLIACDGSRSAVRKKMQVPFDGKELPQHFVFADAEIHSDLSSDEASIFISEHGLLLVAPYDAKYSRIITDVTGTSLCKATSLTYEQVKQLAAERCPMPLQINEPIWTSGFWIHERIIPRYQFNRVFFAGDAAHIHSPVGGQGMNTGIQDAYNLAWKLALVIQEKASPQILETYQIERRPVAADVLKNTTAMTQVMTLRNPLLKWVRNSVIACLFRIRKIRKRFANTMGQLEICYQNSFLTTNFLKNPAGPQAGMRMWDVELGDNNQVARLFDLVRGKEFTVLFFSGKNKAAEQNFVAIKNQLVARYAGLLKYIFINADDQFIEWDGLKVIDNDCRVHQSYGVDEASIYVIRPDKYIGFRGKLGDVGQLERYFLKFLLN